MIPGDPSGSEHPLVWHKTLLHVPLFEVDLGGAVYHGNYYHLFESGREDFLRELGYPYRRFMDQELHLTIVETYCSYRRSLHYEDSIEIHTGIQQCTRRNLVFEQAIYRREPAGDPVLCTRVVLKMMCVRFSGKATTLPEEFVELLEKWIANG